MFQRRHLIDSQSNLCNAFCPCNPSLSASHSHHVHLRRSCTSCPSSPPRTSCTSSPNTSVQRASRMKTGGDLQPCGPAPGVSGARSHAHSHFTAIKTCSLTEHEVVCVMSGGPLGSHSLLKAKSSALTGSCRTYSLDSIRKGSRRIIQPVCPSY